MFDMQSPRLKKYATLFSQTFWDAINKGEKTFIFTTVTI